MGSCGKMRLTLLSDFRGKVKVLTQIVLFEDAEVVEPESEEKSEKRDNSGTTRIQTGFRGSV